MLIHPDGSITLGGVPVVIGEILAPGQSWAAVLVGDRRGVARYHVTPEVWAILKGERDG